MSDTTANRGDFLSQATALIVENAANDQFGVSELAEALHMSRSNLLRKIRTATNLSASQFIRQVRLEIAMDLLKETSLSVSEISFKVGFGSASYFIKCFREQYGYPPGEVGKAGLLKSEEEEPVLPVEKQHGTLPLRLILMGLPALVIIAVLLFYFWPSQDAQAIQPEKSIAVLPFKNESSDSTNQYFVNGLMEATLTNLQKIKDLRVISRSSVEKYRNSNKTIPEIAKDLHVRYFVEGSGQKVGHQVLLNIQLIDASSDRHLWAAQYNREVVDIFGLQDEVAIKIADAIEAIVTPDERQQIEKRPTQNLQAYDFYLQALEPFYTRTPESLRKAIGLFKKAIEHDQEFALAYADVAISYYLLEMSQAEKQHTEEINSYSDKALLYDSRSAESLIAKSFYYIQTKEYSLALPYLKKALEYNPNSSLAAQMLADFYFRLVPNTEKYLKYALKGLQLNVGAADSITQSYTYVQLSNALLSSGFFDEALKYVDLALAYYPQNYFAPHLKAFVLFAKDGNVSRTTKLLISEWKKDTTRLDILQDIGKLYYIEEDYDSAFFYYQKFVEARAKSGQDIYSMEDAKISLVYKKKGLEEEAARLFRSFCDYCENDQSTYRSANLAVKYAYEGKEDQAMEQLKAFAKTDHYPFWFLLFEGNPVVKSLRNRADFKRTMQKIKDRFWAEHEQLKASLEKERLL